jgi:hypothetical protein
MVAKYFLSRIISIFFTELNDVLGKDLLYVSELLVLQESLKRVNSQFT